MPVFVDAASGTDHPRRCTDESTPCATIQYAVDTYPLPGLGTVVNVRGGATYDETVTLRENTRGEPDAPTVL
ncbi:MAG: hypothetical protein GWN73_32065, partial [Actinobacteria bacterium]|nr:hypothetical protein [Actinomycetota bacterium]NIU69770.1 hypothetical protein [Actinomycetota bacterium]NIW31642.1 hypothetical protein [Actinomycetota bacterium]